MIEHQLEEVGDGGGERGDLAVAPTGHRGSAGAAAVHRAPRASPLKEGAAVQTSECGHAAIVSHPDLNRYENGT